MHGNDTQLLDIGSSCPYKLIFHFFCLSLFRHARRYFVNLVDDQLYEVQRVMGLLAYSANTTLPPYKVSSFICQRYVISHGKYFEFHS